ncbi:hypothetical protein R5R35_013540 [Gryllus longicercus]|uniref:Cyclin N-terminal domain-containing protein n=1 Tax=Gryllus longicercus TaxID=2509291 RepID=A0AAN9VBR5_9ORTH
MATLTTRNLATDENQGFKVKQKPQVEVKRAALKEVGNKVVQPKGKGAPNLIKAPEKKQETFPTTNFPVVKQTANKQPSIQVKQTKACLLRAQHSRLSICKVPEKKTLPAAERAPKEGPAPGLKQDRVLKNSQQTSNTGDFGQSFRPQDSKDGPFKCKESQPVTKVSEKETLKEETKTDANSRHATLSAFSSTLLDSSCIVDIDKDDENDPIMLGMYAKDMYKYLREMEVKFPISPQYLKNSKLTGKMRATLIDWLVEVQRDFEMNSETLFLTVAIIDRYLEKNPGTGRNQLQLVGTTAMFIACKYEEMMIPDITELVYVSANAYSKQEILKMELNMVKSLDCSFGRPLPIHFLRRYSKADKVAALTHVMAKYVMEMGILEYELCHIVPSLLAAAALYISLWLSERKSRWSINLVKYSGYTLNDILPVVKRLSMILVTASDSKFQAIRKKYAHPRNLQVSALPVLENLPELIKSLGKL